jgi:hypothetical protein
MKYNTIIVPENTEPLTLTESVEKAVKELGYLDSMLSKGQTPVSPFEKREDTLSPTEFVNKFVREQLKSK